MVKGDGMNKILYFIEKVERKVCNLGNKYKFFILRLFIFKGDKDRYCNFVLLFVVEVFCWNFVFVVEWCVFVLVEWKLMICI